MSVIGSTIHISSSVSRPQRPCAGRPVRYVCRVRRKEKAYPLRHVRSCSGAVGFEKLCMADCHAMRQMVPQLALDEKWS
jgi:hypothetical protein